MAPLGAIFLATPTPAFHLEFWTVNLLINREMRRLMPTTGKNILTLAPPIFRAGRSAPPFGQALSRQLAVLSVHFNPDICALEPLGGKSRSTAAEKRVQHDPPAGKKA